MNEFSTIKAIKSFGLLLIIWVFVVVLSGCEHEQFTVTFESNAEIEIDSIIVVEGDSITLPNTVVVDGYTFKGWYTDEDFTSAFESGSIITEDITLFGNWSLNQYTFTIFDINENVVLTETFYYGDSLAELYVEDLDNVDRQVFLGWDREFPQTMPANNIEIRPIYSDMEYRVLTTHGSSVVETILFPGENIILSEPVSESPLFEFDGWYVNVEGTIPFEYDVMPDEDLHAYPKWKQVEFFLTYIDYNGDVLQQNLFHVGDELSDVTSPEAPVLEGFTFLGWDQDLPTNMPEKSLFIQATYAIEPLVDITADIYDLSQEVNNLLEQVTPHFTIIIDDMIYIAYTDESEELGNVEMIAVDSSGELSCTMSIPGPVYNVTVEDNKNIVVEYLVGDDKNYAVYDTSGTLLIEMNTGIYIGFYIDSLHKPEPLYIGDNTYLYFNVVKDEVTSEITLELLRNNGTLSVLYSIADYKYGRVFLLPNDTLLLVLFKDDHSYITKTIQFDLDGNILSFEDFDENEFFAWLYILEEGYLIWKGGYTYQMRDFDTNILWEQTYDEARDFDAETDDTILFRPWSSSEIEEVVVDKATGEVLSITYKSDEAMLDATIIEWDNTIITKYYRILSSYHLEVIQPNEDTTISLEYDHRFSYSVSSEGFYVFWNEDWISYIDKYNFEGILVSTDSIDGKIKAILDNGNYIVYTEEELTKEINTSGDILWTSEHNFMFVMENGLYMMYETGLSARWFIEIEHIIMDDSGTILYDYSEYGPGVFIEYNDEIYGIGVQGSGYLFIHNYYNDHVFEIQTLYGDNGVYYCYIDGRIVVIEL